MNVMVIGDVIWDTYVTGTKRGVSAETPTIVADFVQDERFFGGAGLVVRHLMALENHVLLLTIAGPLDSIETGVKSSYEKMRFSYDVIRDPLWKISEKKRFFVDGYKLLQFDAINHGRQHPGLEDELIKKVTSYIQFYDRVVVCDNRHGVISERIAKDIVKLCKKHDKPLYVDSQVSQNESNHEWYKGASYIFLNEKELDAVLKKMGKTSRISQLEAVSKFLNSAIILKRGAEGSILQEGKAHIPSPGFKVDAVDTCGAGDAFLAAYISTGSQEFANRWAALSTTYKGTVVPDRSELEKIK